MAIVPGLVFSVSHTTRPSRPEEIDGSDYHFVSRETFHAIRSTRPSGFLEWAEVHGNFYGTSRVEVAKHLDAGDDVILDIDVQGAIQVQQSSEPVSVFIAPPSEDELEARLRRRGTESETEIRLRLQNARKEMAFSTVYDYFILNDRLEEAVDSLRSIIVAERCRRRRAPDGSPVQMQS